MELLSYLLKVSTCLGSFYIFYHLFLKWNTFFGLNRVYLLATLLLSFVVPAYTFEIERIKTLQVITSEDSSHEEGMLEETMLTGSGSSLKHGEAFLTWPDALAGIYITGAVLVAIFLFRGLVRVYRLTRLPATEDGSLRIVKHSAGYSNSSFFNYLFIDLDDLSESEARTVIAHERIHAIRYHSVDKLLVMLCRIVLWFNPFIYWYKKALEEVHEYEADIRTAEQYGHTVYASVLLDVSSNKGKADLLNHFAKSQLKKRIQMLFKPKSVTMKKLTYLLTVPVLLCMVYGFSIRYVDVYRQIPAQQERNAYMPQINSAEEYRNTPLSTEQQSRKTTSKTSVAADTIKQVPFSIVSASKIAGTRSARKFNAYDAEINIGHAKLYASRAEIDHDARTITSVNAKIVSKASTLTAEKIVVNLENNTWTAFDNAEATITPVVKTLVIDAGHGGKDDATRGIGGITEKELNLRAAFILKEEAEKRGLKVLMTRHDDAYVSLSDRVKTSGDLFISLHHNSFPVNQKNARSKGIELVVSSKSAYFDQSKALVNNVLAKLAGLEGIKVRNEVVDLSLLVLKESKSPSFLVELGNVDVASDLNFMRNDDNLRKVCNLILDGVLK